VLFTGPSSYLAKAAPTLDKHYLDKLNSIQYLGIVCHVLVLKRPLSKFYITNLIEKNLFFTGVIEMTSLISTEETAGRHLVYLPRYTVPDDPAFSLEDDEIRRRMMADLRRIHPNLQGEDVEKDFVFRAQIVQPIPVLSYSKLLPDMETSIPGLYLANSTFILNGTLNNNEMIKIALQAVTKITKPGTHQVATKENASVVSEVAIPEAGTVFRA
jgi:protoporphyrinogen oxidase